MNTKDFKWIIAFLLVTFPMYSGTITGKVDNGTRGFAVPGGLTVELTRYEESGEDTQFKMNVPLNSNGEFVFTNVPDSIRAMYAPVVVYQGVKYRGEMVMLSPEQSQATSAITIYEPTNSDSLLRISYHHLLVKPGEGFVAFQEIMVVENPGDRTYIGNSKAANGSLRTLFFPLPTGAKQVSLTRGLMTCCVETTPDGFFDTMEFLPGRKEFVFSYRLDAPNESLDFIRRASLPTAMFDVIPVDPTIQISGNGFQTALLEGTQLTRYSRTDLTESETISFTITGLSGKPMNLSYVYLIAIAGFLLLAGGYVVFKTRRTPPSPDMPTASSAVPERTEDPQKLIQEIALLDEAFEANEMEEEEYRIQREALKLRLQNLATKVLESDSKA